MTVSGSCSQGISSSVARGDARLATLLASVTFAVVAGVASLTTKTVLVLQKNLGAPERVKLRTCTCVLLPKIAGLQPLEGPLPLGRERHTS